MILGGLVLELHMIVLVAFKERTFSFLLGQRAPSQKQSCVHFNPPPPKPQKHMQPGDLRGYGALGAQA